MPCQVRGPAVSLRVTDHIDSIIRYVDTIVGNGYGYISEGNVYFDTQRYSADYDYAQLTRGQLSTTDEVAEWAEAGSVGGGSQSAANGGVDSEVDPGNGPGYMGSKRHPADFALWKRCRPHEEAFGWTSPWGVGRPGWHVECSAVSQLSA